MYSTVFLKKGLLEKYTFKEYNSVLQAFMVTKIYT